MENYITHGSLNIHNDLDRFLKEEVLTELDITRDEFWEKFEEILSKFHHRNKDLLTKSLTHKSYNKYINNSPNGLL